MKSRAFIATLVAAAGSASAQWSDNFNRADGPIGGDWTQTSGTWVIQSNQGKHTSASPHEILTHNSASLPYALSTTKLDIFRTTGTTANTLTGVLIGLGGTDAIMVKIQAQTATGDFSNIGIYHMVGTGWGAWAGGLPFGALTAPFSSGRMTVTFPDPNTLKVEIDTDFNGTADQTYTSAAVSTISAGFGTKYGITGWMTDSSFDNWSVDGSGAVLGACCLPNFSCVSTTATSCAAQNGTYRGDNVTCALANCPLPPTGACCLPDGTCSTLSAVTCLAQNGLFGGANSTCGAANCAKAFVYNGQAIPIPDGLGSTECGTDVFAEVTVPDSFTIAGAEASYHIAHTFQGDVSISLEKVGGPTVVLVDRPGVPAAAFGFGTDNYGGGPANAQRFISTDGAANIYDAPATAGTDSPVGRWKSENSMGVFNGLNSNGVWRLHAKDCAGADTGSIIAFTLLLKGPAGTTTCYANCDNSTIAPCLNVNDFTCFLNSYGAGSAYANCDASTLTPVLNVNDFTCFLNSYSAGCGANNCSPHP